MGIFEIVTVQLALESWDLGSGVRQGARVTHGPFDGEGRANRSKQWPVPCASMYKRAFQTKGTVCPLNLTH